MGIGVLAPPAVLVGVFVVGIVHGPEAVRLPVVGPQKGRAASYSALVRVDDEATEQQHRIGFEVRIPLVPVHLVGGEHQAEATDLGTLLSEDVGAGRDRDVADRIGSLYRLERINGAIVDHLNLGVALDDDRFARSGVRDDISKLDWREINQEQFANGQAGPLLRHKSPVSRIRALLGLAPSQGRDDDRYDQPEQPSYADTDLAKSPLGLFLRSHGSAPLYAVIGLGGVLGGLAAWLAIRGCAIRALLACGGACVAAVGVAVAYYT
jgi:hypothetical protein